MDPSLPSPPSPAAASASQQPQPDEVHLTVSGMAYGGKGIARLATAAADRGKVYFISGGIEGDEGFARITDDAARYGEAEMLRLTQPSPLRGAVSCPHYGPCGGCQWLGVDRQHQEQWKAGFVTAALRRIGKLPGDYGIEVLSSPAELGYRNRILVRVHHQTGEGLKVGYFRRGSHELIPISSCAIAAPAVAAFMTQLHQLPTSALAPFKARIEIQEVPALCSSHQQEEGGKLLVTVYPADGDRDSQRSLVAMIQALPHVYWCGLVFDLKTAPLVAYDEQFGITYFTKPGQFQQVNLAHNHRLRALVRDFVASTGADRVLDVFCGSGNLSLALPALGCQVEGIELSRDAITVARHAAAVQGLSSCLYLAGDAEKHLWKCDRGGESFDLVLLDPPRQGLFKGMVPLRNIAPRHIVYVSCDPTTLARDLAYLLRQDLYELTNVVALDFFPQTYHIETVAFLRRR